MKRRDSNSEDSPLKQRDAWWTVLVVDPIAIRVTHAVRDWNWITPNRVSLAGVVLGVASGILFLEGQLAVGAVCFEIRFLFDCIDGKLARLRGQSSPQGAFLDLAGDKVMIAWNFAGLSWHVASEGVVPGYLPIVLVGAYLVRSWLILYRMMLNARDGSDWESRFGLMAPSRAGDYRRWMADRRLVGRPMSIDVENLTCFVGPLLGAVLTGWALWGASADYVAVVVVTFRRIIVFLSEGPGGPRESPAE